MEGTYCVEIFLTCIILFVIFDYYISFGYSYMIYTQSCVTFYGNSHFISIILLSSVSLTYSIRKNVSIIIMYPTTTTKIFNYLINCPYLFPPSIQLHFPYSIYNSSPSISSLNPSQIFITIVESIIDHYHVFHIYITSIIATLLTIYYYYK